MKYILIIGDCSELVVDEIINWMVYYSDIKIIRLSPEDKLKLLDIHIGNDSITKFSININESIVINFNDIISYYFRRGGFNLNGTKLLKKGLDMAAKPFFDATRQYYHEEWQHIVFFLHYALKNNGIKSLNSYLDISCNKLINLEIAKKIGLNIPDTIISNSLSKIKDFIQKHKKVITKPVNSPFYYYYFNEQIISYSQSTNLFTLDQLEKLAEKHSEFQPTQFQEYVEKEFEIRTFYMKEQFYSMAIFSQNNDKTKIDFRNYDLEKPNRNVPFKLPKEIEEKVCRLMQQVDFDTGSLDFIYADGKYTFLEINNAGLFQWLSKNCNYYIEKEICNYLIN